MYVTQWGFKNGNAPGVTSVKGLNSPQASAAPADFMQKGAPKALSLNGSPLGDILDFS